MSFGRPTAHWKHRNGGGYKGRARLLQSQNLTEVNGVLYFSADDGANGRELWIYDGSALTRVDINSSGDSNPAHMAAFNGTVYFSAEGDTGDGRELWKLDSSSAILADDIHATAGSDPSELVVMGAHSTSLRTTA